MTPGVRRAAARLLALTGVVLAASAHVGSPDVWLEGQAGPYSAVVNVQVPGVVPGIAHVYVRVTGNDVQQVAASANKYDAMAGSPPPDVAEPVSGDPGLYKVSLWIMTPGSNSITIFVRGARGAGTLLVPAVVVANQRLTFSKPMAAGLAAIGVLLFLGAVSIVGAIVREGVLIPGAAPDRRRRGRARLTMVGATLAFAVVLLGGWRWWNAEDQRFARTLYQPMSSHATVHADGVTRTLDFVITDSAWLMRNDREWFAQRAGSFLARRNASVLAPLVPDHGKLMHLVLVHDPDLHVFAHLHPTTRDSITFSVPLPALPAGHYRVYADVVRESGDAETMVAAVDLPPVDPSAPPAASPSAPVVPDSDDSWHAGPAAGDRVTLDDGSVMQWMRGTTPLVVGRPAPLTFTVTDSAGHAIALQPYMGMASHAIVLRDDGAVFMHLHPTGTVAMAAQEALSLRRRTDTVAGMVARRMQGVMQGGPGMAMPMDVVGDTVHFPYAFPKPGRYHIWVQVKRGGRVLTGVFQGEVRG